MTWIGRLFHRRRLEAELRKELEYHVQRQMDDYRKAGLTEAEARRKARLEFGGKEQIGEVCRDARGTRWLESIFEDVRSSQRILRKSRAFAIAAVVTLALGIGANLAIFRLLDAVRLRALPVKDPQDLAIVQLADMTGWRGSQATAYPALTNPIWEQFRDNQKSFSGVLAWGDNDFNIAPGGEARLVHGLFVSGDFFKVLGVTPLLGRVFTAAEDQRGCGLPGAVISYAFWQREFGGDASVIGRKLTLNDQKTEIVGVTPEGFSGPEVGRSYDVAVPICSQAVLWNAGNWLNEGTVWWLTVMGRLKPGESREQVNAQLRATSPALFRATLPSNYPTENVNDYLKFKLKALPASGGVSFLRDQYDAPLLLLLAITGLVLLIACANLANLILARSTARAHEFAVRLAIGASRRRLVQQLMTEALFLTCCGVVAGLFVSDALTHFLIALLGTQGSDLFLDLRPDWRMLVFTAGVASLTCILFGVTPAFQATRAEVAEALKAGVRSLSTTRQRFGLRQFLVVTQVSLSLVLIVSALLFSGSLRNLMAVDTGFRVNGILVADIDLSRLQIPVGERIEFKRNLLGRVRAVPGVISAAEVSVLPISGNGTDNAVWKDKAAAAENVVSHFNWLGPGYLRTMGITLLSGRDFDDHDTASSPRVAIVNQSFARKLGLGANPVGQRFRRQATPSSPEMAFEIVGFVKDTKYFNLREEFAPITFLPVAQDTQPDPFEQIVIRSGGSLAGIASGVRSATEHVSKSIGLNFQVFEDTVRDGLTRERLMATLSSMFGILAVLIASVGLYGVMSYIVARRTNEIGVRMALGANRANIAGLILRQAGVLLAAGIGTGVAFALIATRMAQSMLFGLKPYDARTFMLGAILLATVTLVASYLPARRAARLEPMTALREE
jgi:putative ABC transport system permease protein